jgi:hypothetical protein
LTPLPTLDQLAADPARTRDLPSEVARDLLVRLVGLQTVLLARALNAPAGGNGQPEGQEDRLLTVDEASRRLSVSKDWLYRNAKKMPFAVRPTPGTLRFSLRAIEKFIRERRGR